MTGMLLNFRLEGRLCVVVGGGSVGERKTLRLLEAGASVRLIDPEPLAPRLRGLVEHVERGYRDGDLQGGWLVFAATDETAVNQAVVDEARRRKLPVNVADDPARCDFTLPACRRVDGLTLGVATGGGSPALASLLADRLAEEIAAGWPQFLSLASALRAWQLTHQQTPAYNQSILRQLIDSGVVGLLAASRQAEVDRLLQRICGPECSLAELQLNFSEGAS